MTTISSYKVVIHCDQSPVRQQRVIAGRDKYIRPVKGLSFMCSPGGFTPSPPSSITLHPSHSKSQATTCTCTNSAISMLDQKLLSLHLPYHLHTEHHTARRVSKLAPVRRHRSAGITDRLPINSGLFRFTKLHITCTSPQRST